MSTLTPQELQALVDVAVNDQREPRQALIAVVAKIKTEAYRAGYNDAMETAHGTTLYNIGEPS